MTTALRVGHLLTCIVPGPHAVEVEHKARGVAADGGCLLAAAGRALREVALHALADARPRFALQHLPQLLAAGSTSSLQQLLMIACSLT